MKATLTIEVPDDFIKGQCWRCKLHEANADYDTLRCSAMDGTILDAYQCNPSEVIRSDCPLEIQEESRFIVNEDMFGRYCKIPTGFSKDMHVYKVIRRLESNAWMETPITCKSKVVKHETMAEVLDVIHCGVDETEVIRVALKDVELVQENNQ